jgi:hypothetical protein
MWKPENRRGAHVTGSRRTHPALDLGTATAMPGSAMRAEGGRDPKGAIEFRCSDASIRRKIMLAG